MPKDIKAFLQYMFKGRHGAILCLLCLSVVCVMSSSGLYGGLFSVSGNGQADTVAGRPTKVYLLHADKARADEQFLPGVQILIGHIKFRHDSMYMYCDSAHVYNKTNSFEAFGTVRMEQGDTLFIYGDYLFYDGIVKLAKLRNNVKMINRNTTLMTDSLNYDRVANLGYYFDEGVLFDESNTLTSYWGEYSPETKIARFNENVELTNDSMLLTSDTLIYNTTTKIANIVGPSDIYNGDNHIYSELGYYNTGNDRAELFRLYYLEYLCKAAKDHGMAPFYWDAGGDGSGNTSALFDRATGAFVHNAQEVIDVMKRAVFTQDAAYTLQSVYDGAPQ